MKFRAVPYSALPCELETFLVNGKKAARHDFVGTRDEEPRPDSFCCGNMQAFVKTPTDEILEKYSISEDEFHEIAEYVAKILSVGYCCWCA